MAYLGLSQHIDFCRLPIPTDRFELIHMIGEGTYGEVWSAKDKKTNRTVAVKVERLKSLNPSDYNSINFRFWRALQTI